MKKLTKVFLLILFLFFLFPTNNAFAQEEESINIYFFWGDGCPHCKDEKPFLAELENKYPQVVVHDYEVWKNKDNLALLTEIGKELEITISGVPFTIIGERYVSGWYSEETTGAVIESAVIYTLNNGCNDVAGQIIAADEVEKHENEECSYEEDQSVMPQQLNIPFLGTIDTKNISLPIFTILLGVLDGFNPCAMWTLIFLISLLLGMKDRKRMWILGTAFIVSSAAVYFLFMAAWLNLFLFVGFIVWVRILIGLVALSGGGYSLREYWINKDGACKVTGSEKRQKTFKQLEKITHNQTFILALGGIILLAFAVNLVELICSAGLPAVFTQVLSLSDLPQWQYYLYLLLYIFFFMIDDLFVFITAMVTLKMTGISTKYSRFSHLIGGILMVIIGILLIFKPELLMFG